MTTTNQVRKDAAALARDLCNMFRNGELKGGWSRREWYRHVRIASHNYIIQVLRFDRINNAHNRINGGLQWNTH
jgi:hypothetical protein